jgi:hypothetical protein
VLSSRWESAFDNGPWSVRPPTQLARIESSKEIAMAQSLLLYDGTTYVLSADVAKDLLDRGVIVVDPSSETYALSLDHEIAEVEPFATVLERRDAPRLPRLGRLRVRDFSLLGGLEQRGFAPTTNRLAPDENEPRDR